MSDRSLDELHELARRLGKRRLGFQGDHYDIDELDRDRALLLGAEAVDGRELVRRLRAAGLRQGRPKPSWVRLATSAPGSAVGPVHDALRREGVAGTWLSHHLERLGDASRHLAVGAFGDARTLVLLVDVGGEQPMVAMPEIDGEVGARIGPVELVVGEPTARTETTQHRAVRRAGSIGWL